MRARSSRNWPNALSLKATNLGGPCQKTRLLFSTSSSNCRNQHRAQWKSQLLEGAVGVLGSEAKAESATATVDLKTLHAEIGELTLENDFLKARSRRRDC